MVLYGDSRVCVNKRRITPERKDGDAYLPARFA